MSADLLSPAPGAVTPATGSARPVAPGRTDAGPASTRWSVLRRPPVLLAVILTTQLMVVLDGTIVNVALPDLQRSLHFSPTALSWVINAYGLTFGGLLMFGARCGDLLGRRRTYLAGIAVFCLGSLAGGVAGSSGLLLAARALQGIGGALAAPAALSLLISLFPEGRERVRAIGLYTAVSVGGAASGLLAGGLLTQLASWRWVFFVNLPIGIAVLAVGGVAIRETARQRGSFDVLGALSSTGGVGALVYGFVEAASAGWRSPLTLGAFAVGVALVALFLVTETRAQRPILPLHLLADRTRGVANLARGLLFAGGYGLFFFLTQFLQNVRGMSPIEAGLAFLPIPLTVFSVSQLTARVLVRRFPARRLMLAGLALSATGMAIGGALGTSSSYLQVLPTLLLFGCGNGISFVTLTTAALSGVTPSDAGAASGLLNVTQQLGAALGVSILVTVFGAAAGSGTLSAARFTSGLDVVMVAAAAILAVALALVATFVRLQPVPADAVPVATPLLD